jgi:anti-anti-sigma factor
LKLEGHVIIRRLTRASVGAAAQDGGSGGVVTIAERTESVQLELSHSIGADGYQVVSVSGELDIATADQAYAYLSGVIDSWPVPLQVDLSGLTFCDASGLGVLARVANHARRMGRQLRLTSVRPPLLKIMRITGLDGAFPEVRAGVPEQARAYAP